MPHAVQETESIPGGKPKEAQSVLVDIRFALRSLTRHRGFTVVAVLTLAVGLGATTAVFSVIDVVLLRPLPFAQPENLVLATRVSGGRLANLASWPDYLDWRDQTQHLKDAIAVAPRGFLWWQEAPEILLGARVSPAFFDVLGVTPQLGRVFHADDSEALLASGAVISHRLWSSLGEDSALIGRQLEFGEERFRVLGVLPASFREPLGLAGWDVVIPLVLGPRDQTARSSHWLSVVGRLRPGSSLKQASEELQSLSRNAYAEAKNDRSLGFELTSLHEEWFGSIRQPLVMVLTAVAILLLVGCLNLSSLLMARHLTRRRELAVRSALGASRARLFRLLLMEGLVVAALGGLLAQLSVAWSADLIHLIAPSDLPRFADGVPFSSRVWLFGFGISLLGVLFFASFPALRSSRTSVLATFDRHGSLVDGAQNRLRGLLLFAQVALTVVLVTAGILTMAGFARLLEVDPGFRTDHLLGFTAVPLSSPGGGRAEFTNRLLEEIRTIPGVVSAGAASSLPLSGTWGTSSFSVEELTDHFQPELAGESITLQDRKITAGYLETMGFQLLEGRFSVASDFDSPKGIVVNKAMARLLWGNESALGRTLFPNREQTYRVIGVVGDIRHFSMEQEPEPTYYEVAPGRARQIVVRTGAENALDLMSTLRQRILQAEPATIIRDEQTMSARYWAAVSDKRFYAVLLGAFAALASIVSGVGVFGLVSFLVSQRIPEVGLRIALGARPSRAFLPIAGSVLLVTGTGALVGLACAILAGSWLRSLLYGIGPQNPIVLLSTVFWILFLTVLGSWVPARRAMRVDPVEILNGQ